MLAGGSTTHVDDLDDPVDPEIEEGVVVGVVEEVVEGVEPTEVSVVEPVVAPPGAGPTPEARIGNFVFHTNNETFRVVGRPASRGPARKRLGSARPVVLADPHPSRPAPRSWRCACSGRRSPTSRTSSASRSPRASGSTTSRRRSSPARSSRSAGRSSSTPTPARGRDDVVDLCDDVANPVGLGRYPAHIKFAGRNKIRATTEPHFPQGAADLEIVASGAVVIVAPQASGAAGAAGVAAPMASGAAPRATYAAKAAARGSASERCRARRSPPRVAG